MFRGQFASSPAAARRAFVGLLVGPLLGFVVPEALLRNCRPFWDTLADATGPEVSRADGLLALTEPGSVDVVVLGSSMAYDAIDETRLQERLRPARGRTLNLGVSGQSALGTAMWLPRVLARQPLVLVYVVGQRALAHEYEPDDARFYDPRVALRVFSVPTLIRDRDWHLRGVGEWLSVLQRRARPILEAKLTGQESRRQTVPRDAPFPPRQVRAHVARQTQLIQQSPVTGAGPNIRALWLMAEMAQEARVPLVVLQAPLHPGVTGFPRTWGNYSSQVEGLLDQLTRRSPGTPSAPPSADSPPVLLVPEPSRSAQAATGRFVQHVPAERLGSFGAAAYRDATHLAPSGRQRLTDTLAEALRPLME